MVKITGIEKKAFDPTLWSCYVENAEAFALFKSIFDYLKKEHGWSFYSIAKEAGLPTGINKSPGAVISSFYNKRHRTLNLRYIAAMYRVTKDKKVRGNLVNFLKHPQVKITRTRTRIEGPKDEIIDAMINLVVGEGDQIRRLDE